MEYEIIKDDLADGKVIELLKEHLKEMQKYSPPESIHALDLENLRDASITFWSVRGQDEVMGCGALKALSARAGEIKSMKTNPNYLRKGVAEKVLESIVREAEIRCFETLSLETGTHSVFDPAVSLYKKHGFSQCKPFGDYVLDPFSRFFTKTIG